MNILLIVFLSCNLFAMDRIKGMRPAAETRQYLPCDEGTGSLLNDVSIGTSPATLAGDWVWVDGIFGKAVEYDGSSGYATFPNSLDYGMEFSVSLWFKKSTDGISKGLYEIDNTDDVANYYRHISIKNGYYWQDENVHPPPDETDGKVPGQIEILSGRRDDPDSIVVSTKPTNGLYALNNDKWHNLFFTRDGSTITLYVDGNFQPKGDEETAAIDVDCDVTRDGIIGAGRGDTGGVSYYYDGTIDEVKFWGKTICKEEATYMYSSQMEDMQ